MPKYLGRLQVGIRAGLHSRKDASGRRTAKLLVGRWREAHPALARVWYDALSKFGAPPIRAGLHSRKDTRDARVCLAGVGPEGRPYVIDGPSAWACHLEEINHVYWAATGLEPEKKRND